MSFREFHAAIDGHLESRGKSTAPPVTRDDFAGMEHLMGPSRSIRT